MRLRVSEHMRLKILIPIIFIILLMNSTSFLFVSNEVTKSMKGQMRVDLDQISKTVADVISTDIETEFASLRTLSHFPLLVDSSVNLYDKSQFVYQFYGINKGTYIDLCITDTEGNAYISGTEKLLNFAERNYFKIPLTGKNYIEPPFINKVTNAMAIFFGTPVYNDNGKIENVLFSAMDGYRFCELLEKYPVGKTSTALVVDRQTGKIQGAADKSVLDDGLTLADYEPGLSGILASGSNTFEYKDKDGNVYLAAIHQIEGTDWAIVAPAPLSDYSETMRQAYRNLTSIYVLILLIAVGFMLLVLNGIMKPIKSMEKAIAEISMGDADLTKRIESKSKDEIGRVVHNFNSFTRMLREIIVEIKSSKDRLAGSGNQLSSITGEATQNLSVILDDIKNVDGQILNQSTNVSETVDAIAEISQSIKAMESMIERQSAGVSEASAAVEQMIGNISSVNSSTEKMSDSFQSLADKAQEGAKIQKDVSERITEIENQAQLLVNANKVINAIAGQTNLLAMNAAIEAAHAGEAGQGFAVVADEIRNLSETSSKQSKTIGQQIGKIRESIGTLVAASQESNAVFLSVSEKISETQTIVMQIRSAMMEQHEGSSQVMDALTTVTSSTNEVRKSSADVSTENVRITDEIRKLREATDTIRSCVADMNRGTVAVEDSSKKLTAISEEMQGAIRRIGFQIDMFTV